MKSKKAIKRLTRVEKLLADVQFHYSAIEKPLGKLLSSAKASVAGIRESIAKSVSAKAAQAKTAKAAKSKSKQPRKATAVKAGKAAPAKAKRRASAKGKSAKTRRPPATPNTVAGALEVSTPS